MNFIGFWVFSANRVAVIFKGTEEDGAQLPVDADGPWKPVSLLIHGKKSFRFSRFNPCSIKDNPPVSQGRLKAEPGETISAERSKHRDKIGFPQQHMQPEEGSVVPRVLCKTGKHPKIQFRCVRQPASNTQSITS